jgi:hypothetical protein
MPFSEDGAGVTGKSMPHLQKMPKPFTVTGLALLLFTPARALLASHGSHDQLARRRRWHLCQ